MARIAVLSTTTYSSPPLSYGGEAAFYFLAKGFCELGHDVTLYAAPGSLPPHENCRCKLSYIPGTYSEIDYAREWLLPEWHYDEIMQNDWILDCSLNHPVAEWAGWYGSPEQQRKIAVVLNGTTSHTPRCGLYNTVVGSQKWKELLLYGRTQFYGTPFEKTYGASIEPVPGEAFLGIVPFWTDVNFYIPGDAPKEDYFLFLSRPTAYKGCLPQGQQVFSNPSLVDIACLKPGQRVLGDDARFHQITSTTTRDYSGPLVELTPYCINLPTRLTPEHPVLVVSVMRHSDGRPCKGRIHCQTRGHKPQFNPIYIPAANVDPDRHYLLHPIPRACSDEGATEVSLKDAITDISFDCSQGRFRHRARLDDGREQRVGDSLPETVEITGELLWFCGRFIAEGTATRKGVVFSLGGVEMSVAERLQRIGQAVFGLRASVRRPRPNTVSVTFSSKLLSRVFRTWFGARSFEKHIPEWIIRRAQRELGAFLDGVWGGDGCVSKSKGNSYYSYGTVSATLALQLFHLLAKLGIISHVGYWSDTPKGGNYLPSYVQVTGRDNVQRMADVLGHHSLSVSQRRHYGKAFMIGSEYLALPVRKKREIPFDGKVYNCEVRENPSYMVNGIIVHNCAQALELAGERKLHLKIVPGLGHASHSVELEQLRPLIEAAIARGAKIDVVAIPQTSQHHVLKRELYRRARALLAPVQAHEPFGLTLIEAMACNTPVICSSMGAFPEIIKHGETGFLCRNKAEYLEAIDRVTDLPREAPRADAESRWHYVRAARDYIKLLEG